MTAPLPRRKPKRLARVRRRHIALAAGLIILALAALDVALLVNRAAPPRHLLYTSDGFLHGLNLATGEDRMLAGAGALDPAAAASPDGERLAYWEQDSGNWRLMIQTPGQASTRTSLGEFDVAFATLAWSPDGTRLAFAIQDVAGATPQNGAYETELVILNVATGELTQLTDNTYRDDSPTWSPDGQQLVFTSSADGYNRLHVIDVATRERHLLTDAAFGYVPAWSPDGALIAFMSNHEDSHGDIYVIDADGSHLRRLTFTPARDDNPTWLP